MSLCCYIFSVFVQVVDIASNKEDGPGPVWQFKPRGSVFRFCSFNASFKPVSLSQQTNHAQGGVFLNALTKEHFVRGCR